MYIYFDFTRKGENPEGYRGYKTCELNFGTESRFHMDSPTQSRRTHLLAMEKRVKWEKIEPGFWGDERIYNVSALVGDNGSGKSMLIHEIIRCLMSSFHEHLTFEKLVEPQYPFVFVTESVNGDLYLVNFGIAPEVCGFPEEWKRINLPIEQNGGRSIVFNWGLDPPKPRKEYGVLRRTKMIYFSNAITMADKNQYDYWNYYEITNSTGYSVNSQYSSPMFDCSLISDMSEAIKISRADVNTFDEHLNTYFNFRSYQEARYVFDRNQRRILLDMRDKHHLPVPLPKLLKLSIINPNRMEAMAHCNSAEIKDYTFSKYYNTKIINSNAQRFAAVLSMNCILAYCMSKDKRYFEDAWSKCAIDAESTQCNKFFFSLLTCCNDSSQKRTSDYFKMCQRYVVFLWSNILLIDKYFRFGSIDLDGIDDITVEIPLGDAIDSDLEEFMIQFVNLTRAVSKNQYFVVYNWGLSSGESNLLHLFTKLRYALTGNVFDKERDVECAIETSKPKAQYTKREEKLLTTTDNKTMHDCDSVILFIDEADLTYHPEWQRQFVAILTEFLPRMYTNPYYPGSGSGCKEIQVILSTHSPLMLSDFPAASVTYLRKNDDGTSRIDNCRQLVTFGENLYTILKDSFYLNNGAVGEFARLKIEQVLSDTARIREESKKESPFQDWTAEKINHSLNCLNNHEKKTVQYLAHGVMRSKLEEEINNCRYILYSANHTDSPKNVENTDYKARIQQLEREKVLLERKINAMKRKEEASE